MAHELPCSNILIYFCWQQSLKLQYKCMCTPINERSQQYTCLTSQNILIKLSRRSTKSEILLDQDLETTHQNRLNQEAEYSAICCF